MKSIWSNDFYLLIVFFYYFQNLMFENMFCANIQLRRKQGTSLKLWSLDFIGLFLLGNAY